MLQLSVNSPVDCPAQQPVRWPFPPRKPVSPRNAHVSASAVPVRRPRTRVRGAAATSQAAGMSRRAMLADICMVAAWAAAIPGLMWLGAVAGF